MEGKLMVNDSIKFKISFNSEMNDAFKIFREFSEGHIGSATPKFTDTLTLVLVGSEYLLFLGGVGKTVHLMCLLNRVLFSNKILHVNSSRVFICCKKLDLADFIH